MSTPSRPDTAGAARPAHNPDNLAHAMSEAVDPVRLMRRVADQAQRLIANADGVLVAVLDGSELHYVCGAGRLSSYVGTRISLDKSLSGLAVSSREVLRTDNTELDDRVDRDACRRLGVMSSVCVPLRRGDESLGVMNVSSSRPSAFDDTDLAVLTQLAEFISLAIGLAADFDRIRNELAAIDDAGSMSSTANEFMLRVLNPARAAREEVRKRVSRVLADKRLSAVYQPMVDIANRRIVAFEALARIAAEPARSPDLWFDEAHGVGLGHDLELLAVERALEALQVLPEQCRLAINVGPSVITSDALHELLRGKEQRVMLELTEHTRVDSYDALVAALRSLRRAGARVAVDDTGAGISSLAHILKLAPDYIKLDRTLTSGIDLDPVRRALAAALVTFAAGTGAHIVAEGVEREEELDALAALGIRYAQGYHLGRPAPLDTVVELELDQPTGRPTR